MSALDPSVRQEFKDYQELRVSQVHQVHKVHKEVRVSGEPPEPLDLSDLLEPMEIRELPDLLAHRAPMAFKDCLVTLEQLEIPECRDLPVYLEILAHLEVLAPQVQLVLEAFLEHPVVKVYKVFREDKVTPDQTASLVSRALPVQEVHWDLLVPLELRALKVYLVSLVLLGHKASQDPLVILVHRELLDRPVLREVKVRLVCKVAKARQARKVRKVFQDPVNQVW